VAEKQKLQEEEKRKRSKVTQITRIDNSRRKNVVSYLGVFCVVVLMFALAEITRKKEIIFPEIAAIGIGCLLTTKRAWRVTNKQMLAWIAISAWVGTLISMYLPGPKAFQLIFAFAIAQFFYTYSTTTFAPMNSAVVLPVLLESKGVVYPLAAMLLTIVIIGITLFIEQLFIPAKKRAEKKRQEEYRRLKQTYRGPGRGPIRLPIRKKTAVIASVWRVCVMTILCMFAFYFHMPYLIAPPLLVAFTEFTRTKNLAMKMKATTVLEITLCAFAGSICRYYISMEYGLPLSLAAAFTMILVFSIQSLCKLKLPPAGALAILAMLVPEEAVLSYSVQILAGAIVYVAAAAAYNSLKWKLFTPVA